MVEQLTINIALTSLYLGLTAVAFTLTYRQAGFLNFSLAGIILLGPYVTLGLDQTFGWRSIVVSGSTGVLVGGGLNALVEGGVYSRLRRGGATPSLLLLASLGIYIALENCVAIVFTDRVRVLSSLPFSRSVTLLGALITPRQLWALGVGGVASSLVVWLLLGTRVGLEARAVAEDSELALSRGISVERTRRITAGVAGCLLALVGLLHGVDLDVTPTFGLPLFVMGVVSAIIGGLGSLGGAVAGALVVAVSEEVSTLVIGAEWKEGAAFVFVLAVLILRPRGLFGQPEGRKDL